MLVKRFVGTEKRVNKYALVKLHFIKSKNLDDDLQVEANSSGILIDARQLREYFEIEYNENLGDILHVSEIEKNAMIQSLSKSDSEDPSKIYCNKVRRNPNNGHRSEFNADKTKLLRPSLYTYFSNDESISFCYYSDERMENDDETILKNFSSR